MKITKRLRRAWLSLPALYDVQPTSDYQSLISHSANEVSAKAWARTGTGLRLAIRQFEQRHPDVKRRAEHIA